LGGRLLCLAPLLFSSFVTADSRFPSSFECFPVFPVISVKMSSDESDSFVESVYEDSASSSDFEPEEAPVCSLSGPPFLDFADHNFFSF
jgi:hypothetical protein